MRTFALSVLISVCFILSLAFVLPAVTQAAGLVPCDGVVVRCQACKFIELINNLVRWLIVFLTLLCGLLAAIAGLKIVMSGGDSHARSDAKEMFTNVLVGFLILLSAWLIVDTVMKSFVDTSEFGPWNQISCVTPEEGQTGEDDGDTPPPDPSGACTNCGPIPSGITVKSGACGGGGACTISADIAGSLTTLDNSLDSAGINWRVTEAYPPSRTHRDACHSNGTCIDANCIGGCSSAQVKTFINSASSAGLRAVYEVQTQAEKDTLVRSGVSATNVQVLGSWISGAHFSVYKN